MSPTTIRLVAAPLLLLAIFISLYAAWILLDLPPEEELIPIAKTYFAEYGLLTVFVAALLEGLLVIGWYFPGTFVFVLALLLAERDVLRVTEIAILASAGVSISHSINFFVGKYGWYRLFLAFGLREPLAQAQRRLERYGMSTVFATYWQINLASVVSTAAGILQFPLGKFLVYSLAATVFWIGFWTLMIFALGQAALALVNLRFIILAIVLWILLRLILRRRPRPYDRT